MKELEDSLLIVPLRTIILTFVVTLLLDFMPFPFEVFFWLPDLTALTLLFWSIQRPQTVGMGVAFIMGLLVDIGTAASLGVHAISYTVMVFFILSYRRQIVLYGHIMQLLVVWAALLCHQVVLVAVGVFFNQQMVIWQSFIAPMAGALLWPLFSQLMLVLMHSGRSRR